MYKLSRRRTADTWDAIRVAASGLTNDDKAQFRAWLSTRVGIKYGPSEYLYKYGSALRAEWERLRCSADEGDKTT